MNRLSKEDLAQMNRDYFQSLDKQKLVEVAGNLHQLAVQQLEKLEQNSSNSSLPPSSDQFKSKEKLALLSEQQTESQASQTESKQVPKQVSEESEKPKSKGFALKKPGKQQGAKGIWRTTPLVPNQTVAHHPLTCASCNSRLEKDPEAKAHMGYYVLELEKLDSGIEVKCTLHHYYQATCGCGHQTKAKPQIGYVSVVEGRSRDLCLQEYGLVGSMLATFIASLAVRYRMSRPKIKELLNDWVGVSLSVGTIDRCIREVGIACSPVVEELIEELQSAEIIHLDETPWYEKGKYRWLWVAITNTIAVFHIGSRRKEELLHLISEAFVGWLVTDGYGAYSSYPKRQHCLAHLIRKAIALTQALDKEVADLGQWLLEELRELIHALATGDGEQDESDSHPARLYRVCRLATVAEHTKLKALAKEILTDWDAVVACFYHPQLPPTNNEAERALRHAVIARRISYGTRTSEGSLAYCSVLSVVETCRLRKVDPWSYIAIVLTQARKGIKHPPIPVLS
ncbi:transposase [Nostoc sp. 'Peltigera membranacea cyanobiont' 213]|uniref:IS66 family transposase n=1 Tax=Nostoc sp. 'Peltigera membranacea cyanobiont' 213 TaxID=2014530 RepID=UPI000B957E79|nr:IS66 family transposase [Nostoc sp. 'Peltigera membranacea cyanobiont' 213]OYD86499.1 transposase [Nostoc sp. 'Peltigera membranacea cyanobiont' 213]